MKHHIHRMAKTHPHTDATYRVIHRADMSFWAEVNVPGQSPAYVTGFATEAAAEAWITRHKQQIVDFQPSQRWRARPSKEPS